MASIRRQGDRFEVRECISTESGPRQRTLARFHRILTPEVLDEAAGRARRPFDRERLVRRAREQGIAVSEERRGAAARRLIAALRAGEALPPSLVGLLREALAGFESRSVPPHLEDAAEWLGVPEEARGKALRGLLRAASRVAQSRAPVRMPPDRPFPRFSSTETAS